MNQRQLQAGEWERIGALFDRLSEQPREQRRLAELGESATVCRLLERMLDAHDANDPHLIDQTLQSVAGEMFGAPTDQAESIDWSGRRFGPWQCDHEIGRGGMALVLKGHRADGKFDKDVAIKLLPQLTRTGAQRLAEEIRILARLEHPNIARLIDGDIDADGQPYLVMELVDGEPINQYCSRNELDQKARITLLIQVIDAVIHAHRQLVVHCDIKPANILVNTDGQIRLVDFGIAGLLSSASRRETATRGWFCSPTYAAPEQLAGDPPTIRQDVFSLGAVFYELLTNTPLRDNRCATRLWFGLDRSTQPPAPPSILRPDIPRDLDAICLKALAMDADSRYATAEALLDDLQDWLHHRPVSARDGGRGYVLGRWLRRHRLPALAGAVVLVTMSLATGFSLWQAETARQAQQRAESELDRANTLNDVLLSLFQAAEAGYPRDQVPDVQTLLHETAERAIERLDDQPGMQAELLALVGQLMHSVGLSPTGRDMLARAVGLLEAQPDPPALKLALARLSYGEALHYSENFDPATEQLRQAVDELRALEEPGHLARALHALGWAMSEGSGLPQAPDLHREALLIQRGESDTTALALGLSSTARSLQRAGQLDEAIALYEESLPLLLDQFGEVHFLVASVMADFGVALRRHGRYEQAEHYLRRSIAAGEGVYTTAHVTQAQRWNNLGSLLVGRTDHVAAAEALETSLEIFRQLPPESVQSIMAVPLNNLGFIKLMIGDFVAAETHFRQALTMYEQSAGRDYLHHIGGTGNLARSVLAQGRLEEAEALVIDALDRGQRVFPSEDPRQLALVSLHGQILWQRDRSEHGVALVERAYRDTEAHYGSDHVTTIRRAMELAEICMHAGQVAEAANLYNLALAFAVEHLDPLHQTTLTARAGLAEARLSEQDPDAAAAVLAPIGELPPPQLTETDPLRARLAALAQRLENL